MAKYRPHVGLTVTAEQYDGSNLSVIQAVVPDGKGSVQPAHRDMDLILYVPGLAPRLIHPQDWLSWNGERATVHSPESFGDFWELVR